MALSLEQHMEQIRFIERAKRNDRRLAEHSRLLLFHEIIDGNYLEKGKAEKYLKNQSGKFKPFTKLISSSFMLSVQDLIIQKKMSSIHLSVNDDYHLLFFLVEENEAMRVYYDSCSNCDLPQNKFPHIELKQSVILPEKNGGILYDNRISVQHQAEALLKEQYESFRDFIEKTKVDLN